jgi:hypothetical protein
MCQTKLLAKRAGFTVWTIPLSKYITFSYLIQRGTLSYQPFFQDHPNQTAVLSEERFLMSPKQRVVAVFLLIGFSRGLLLPLHFSPLVITARAPPPNGKKHR